jgi:hypothetical protein
MSYSRIDDAWRLHMFVLVWPPQLFIGYQRDPLARTCRYIILEMPRPSI